MTSTTWSPRDVRVDGSSLANYGYGIELRSDMLGLPPRRGDNRPAYGRRGTRWRRKTLDQAEMGLQMWVDARDPTTGAYPVGRLARLAQFYDNMRELTSLLGVDDRELALARDENTLAGGVETLTGRGEVVSGARFQPDEDWEDHARLSVGILMADPLWYGAATSATISGSGGTVVVAADLAVNDMVLTFTGASSAPILTNTTTNPDTFVQFQGVIAGGAAVVIDCQAGTIKRLSDSLNLIPYLRYGGSSLDIFRLLPGSNVLTLSGGGSVTIAYQPPRYV